MSNNKSITLIALQMVAHNVAKLTAEDGICSIRTTRWHGVEVPCVQMLADTFLEYFGDDTEFEYVTEYEQETMQTMIDGVLFFALVD